MSNYNQIQGNWVKSQGTFMTGSANATSSAAVLHEIAIGSYSPGATFRLANGTLTSKTYITGSFTPSGLGLQRPIEFKELEFTNGIFVETGGTINLTVIYNDII